MKPKVDNVGPYAVAIAGIPQYQVAGSEVQRSYSWENVHQEARNSPQQKGCTPRGKESPTTTKNKFMLGKDEER